MYTIYAIVNLYSIIIITFNYLFYIIYFILSTKNDNKVIEKLYLNEIYGFCNWVLVIINSYI